MGTCGLDISGSGKGSVAGSYENGNETSSSIKGGWELLDYFSDYQLLKKKSALWS